MAPWWLRSKKDEPYEDPLEIDEETLASIAVEPEPEDEEEDYDPRADAAAEAAEATAEPAAEPPEKSRRKRRRKRKRRAEAALGEPPAGDDAAPVAAAPDPASAPRDDAAAAAEAAPGPAERGPALRAPAERGPAERGPAERGPALRAPAERGPAERGPAERAHSRRSLDQGEIVFDFGPPERSAVVSHERKIALFCDLENIALGVRNSETKKFDIGLVLERLLEKGKIIVKKAYADWERYSDYKRAFHDAAIELIDIPQKHYSGKNSADIKMVVDAMDLCFSKEHLDTFVIMSGDSDFSPLVSKLKENNKYVIGIGVKNSTSSHLIDNCDEFIYYEDVWRDLQRTPRLDHLSPKDAEVFGLLIDSILALIRENKSVIWGSMIKQTMQRKRPSFSEGSYDYSSFGALLEDAAKKHIIRLKRDQRSGNYVVTGFGQH